MKEWQERLIELIYPPRCAVCGEVLRMEERQGFLCGSCRQIPYFPMEKCPHCGGSTKGGFCESCLKGFAFSRGCSAFSYATVRQAIHLFKYEGDKKIGIGLGKLMGVYLTQGDPLLTERADMIMAVPLHWKKEKSRGFNQTHILCEEISKKTGIPFQRDGLMRKRDTVAQSILSHEERKENLQDAFEATAGVEGKRVLLVDDIFTTGTTCNECAKVLYRAGADEVMIFTLSAAGIE